MTIKLLHTSDLHIDWRFEKFPVPNRAVRRHEVLQTINHIADIAVTEEVQGILIAGDLFHSSRVDRQSLAFVTAIFTRLMEHGIRVLIIPGNHDPATDDSVYSWPGFPDNVYVFKGDSFSVYKGINGVNIYGLPYRPEHAGKRVLQDFEPFIREGWQVAMVHGTFLELCGLDEYYAPVYPEDIAKSGLDYLALGHHHNFRDISTSKVKCAYSGAPVSLSFNNTGERYVVLIDLGEAGPKVRRIAVPTRTYKEYNYDLTNNSLSDLYYQLNKWCDRSVCARITIEGLANEDNWISADQLQEQFKDNFFYLEVIDRSLFVPRIEPLDMSVKGIFIRKINERLASQGISDEERAIAKEALRVGLTLLEGGSI